MIRVLETRSLLVLVLGFSALCTAENSVPSSLDHTHAAFTRILQTHVRDGLVDYSALKADRRPLDAYIQSLASVRLSEFQRWPTEHQLAYLINLYNAETLQLIIDHYPVESIKDIGGLFTKPWDLKEVGFLGKRVTLSTIEHDIIRKNYRDPRIHFALVCAARGCPPLRAEAYECTVLYQQLDEQARTFLNNPEKNRIDGAARVAHLSPIFKWYRGDFGAKRPRVLDYVSRYFSPDIARRLRSEEFSIEYTNYDWSLNDLNGQRP